MKLKCGKYKNVAHEAILLSLQPFIVFCDQLLNRRRQHAWSLFVLNTGIKKPVNANDISNRSQVTTNQKWQNNSTYAKCHIDECLNCMIKHPCEHDQPAAPYSCTSPGNRCYSRRFGTTKLCFSGPKRRFNLGLTDNFSSFF